MNLFKIFFLFSLFSCCLLIISCDDKCDSQICLNGGICEEGICKCPTGYSGSNCETKVDGYNCLNGGCVYVESNAQYSTIGDCQSICSNNTSGFDCQNNSCVQVSSNAQYSSLTVCQNNCSSTEGFNCQSGTCIQVSNNAQYATLTACQGACMSSTSTITFKNNTFTNMTITFNNDTKTITPSGSTSFTGTPNNLAVGTAQTSGKTSSGSQIGLLISWNLNYTFPSTGNSSIQLNVSNSYFFLKLKNTGTSALSPIYVNYNLVSQTVDNISIPNNGTTYNVGYYKAWSNSNVRGIRGSFYTYWNQGEHFNLPFNNNQSATLLNTL